MPRHQRPGGNKLAGLVLVVPGSDRTENASHIRDSGVVGKSKARIHRRQYRTYRRIEIQSTASNYSELQPVRVGRAIEKVLLVREAIVVNNPPISAKLESVLSSRPRDVVDELIDRYIHIHRSQERNLVRQVLETDIRIGVATRLINSLPDEGVTKVVDQRIAKHGRVSCGDG